MTCAPSTHVMHAGMLTPALTGICRLPNCDPFDLTGYTVTFSMRKRFAPKTLVINHAAATIVGNPIAGDVKFTWTDAAQTAAGAYVGWFTATKAPDPAQDFPNAGDLIAILIE